MKRNPRELSKMCWLQPPTPPIFDHTWLMKLTKVRLLLCFKVFLLLWTNTSVEPERTMVRHSVPEASRNWGLEKSFLLSQRKNNVETPLEVSLSQTWDCLVGAGGGRGRALSPLRDRTEVGRTDIPEGETKYSPGSSNSMWAPKEMF